ncbi:MAG: O-antigen ligase family protein [Bacteroidia bacterium]
MTEKKNIAALYIASAIFILADGLMMWKQQSLLLNLLPVAMLIIYMLLFKLDKLILAVVFLTPLSIRISTIPSISLGQVGIGVSLPTEPILLGIMLLFLIRIVSEGLDKSLTRHPVSIVIIIGLCWMIITCITSTMPFVSFKRLIWWSCGVLTFYFLGVFLFDKRKNIITFCWLYIIPFCGVIVYTILRHAHNHFGEKFSHIAATPFYNDHTAYGAMLAMFIPMIAGLIFIKTDNKIGRLFAPFILALFLIAVGFSFSRGAWVSLAAATIVCGILLLRIQLRTILAMVIVALVIGFVYQQKIVMKLEKNNKEVSEDIGAELQSISNISSDASNLERINRWNCAVRMFKDRPVFGFGPGTYMFKYAPYQLSTNRTIISTDLGNGGNAHSEYLGPLSEQGLLGMLSFLAIVVVITIISFRLFYRLKDRDLKIIVLCLYLGLITYFVHGTMNNFLDTDKAAVPFWGFIGAIVAIDIRSRREGLIEEKTKKPLLT